MPLLRSLRPPGKDIQINPHSIGAHLKFFVRGLLFRVRLQERLHHVAVPKLVPSSIGVRVVKKKQLLKAALETQIDGPLRPQNANSGFPEGIGTIAFPIRPKRNGSRIIPLRGRRAGV